MDSAIWLYIALAIVVIALIVAGIGVGLFIKGMKEPMKKIKGSADNLKGRMDSLKLETTSLQHHANELKEDMQVKSEKVTVLIDAAKGTKNSVLDLNSSVKLITSGIAKNASQDKENVEQVNQAIGTTSTVLELWGFWKNRGNATSADSQQLLIENKQQ
ncbi:DUF948 domain-containing protein [Planococcus sp. YIM B11945]|uniref:DUF948 domain-containing protein n=1 Tax=Planococcus sp. YIM B11945 TaxID=3435410 RepID=UPI003D7E8B4E